MYKRIKKYYQHENKRTRENRWIFSAMLIGAIISLTAAFILSIEAFHLARDPGAQLACSINMVIDCAAVAKTNYAELFGFPNSFIGMMAESVVITVAVAGLSGVRFPRPFMFAAQIGYSMGFLFALFLTSISFFKIGIMCPWCMTVTVATIFVFFTITRYNIREDNLYLSKKHSDFLKKMVEKDYDKLLLASTIALLGAAILFKYGANGLFG